MVLVANSQVSSQFNEAKILPTKVGGGVLVGRGSWTWLWHHLLCETGVRLCFKHNMIHAKTNMPNNVVGRPMGEGSWLGRLLCETGVRL